MIVYVATSSHGKQYVGQTINDLQTRRWCHETEAKAGTGAYFQQALKKYGFTNFKWAVLEEVATITELNSREIYWIAKLKTLRPKGYNLTEGGLNALPTAETRQKLSTAHTGKTHTPETLKKMCAAQKGRVISDEAKRKMSVAKKGIKLSKEHIQKVSAALKGRIFSAEHRQKISDAQKGRKFSDEHRRKLSKARQNPSDETRRNISVAQKKRWRNTFCEPAGFR